MEVCGTWTDGGEGGGERGTVDLTMKLNPSDVPYVIFSEDEFEPYGHPGGDPAKVRATRPSGCYLQLARTAIGARRRPRSTDV